MMRLPVIVLLAAASLALGGCNGWQSALDVHGPAAVHLRQLIIGIVAVCCVVWALVMIALILALGRRRAAAPRPPPADPLTERRMKLVVCGAVAATVVVIGAFTVTSFFA